MMIPGLCYLLIWLCMCCLPVYTWLQSSSHSSILKNRHVIRKDNKGSFSRSKSQSSRCNSQMSSGDVGGDAIAATSVILDLSSIGWGLISVSGDDRFQVTILHFLTNLHQILHNILNT